MLNVDEDPVIYDLETMSMCLENLEDLVDYGMVNFLAFMNKKIPYFVNEKILVFVIVMLQFLVKYVLKMVNYLVYLKNHLFLNYEIGSWAWQSLCLAVAWFLSPSTPLVWHFVCFASYLVEGAEGRVFQHAMFGMLMMFAVVLMAVYMKQKAKRHVAVCEHMSRMCKHRQKRVMCKNRRQLTASMFLCSMSSSAAMEQDAV